MWDRLIRAPRGRLSTRKYILFAAAMLVAVFANLLGSSPSVYAADAAWQNNKISYDGREYSGPKTAGENDPSGLVSGTTYYSVTEGSKGYLAYFDKDDEPTAATSINVLTADYDVASGRFSNLSPPERVTIDPAGYTPAGETSAGSTGECNVDGIGWVICPVSNWLAGQVDNIFDAIKDFFVVYPIVGGNNSLYRVWDAMRDIANVLFIIGFLVIIYSYITGGVMDNYSVKKMLPRVVVAAMLINLSYWICAILVDITNIAGVAFNDLFMTMRDSAIGTERNVDISWSETTAYVLSGGAAAAGGLAFLTIAGGSAVSLSFLIFAALIGAAFAVLVALVILAARQALITVMIVIAPIAIAAYILPNTEQWFDRWRKSFVTILMIFPIFSILFGGAQLASSVIMQNAPTLAVLILGLVVQVVPLIITPLLIQFSGGLLGRIAGMTNNKSRGLADRSKNWARGRSEFYRDKNLANRNGAAWAPGRAARGMYRRKQAREKEHETYKKQAENLAHGYEPTKGRYEPNALYAMRQNRSYGNWDSEYRNAELEHQGIEGHHESHWEQQFAYGNKNYNADMARRKLEVDNYRKATKEAQDTFASAAAAAGTYQTILPTDSPEVIADKQRQNKLIADKHGLDNSFKGQMETSRELSQSIAVQGLAQSATEVVAQSQLARLYKDNIKIRPNDALGALDRAAGIDANGATKVEAKATAALTKQHMENVEAVNSIYSNDGYTTEELMKVVNDKKLRGNEQANDMHVHAAIQTILTKGKGNNWAAQKLIDQIATQGMRYDEDTNTYTDINGRVLEASEVADRRDTQQILNSALQSSPLKVDYISATMRASLENGLFAPQDGNIPISEQAILSDARIGKFDQQRIVSADVDVLQRMVQVFRDPAKRASVSEERRAQLLKVITDAQGNPQINAVIKDRERGVMNALAAYLDKDDERTGQAKEAEYHYVLDENDNKVRVSQKTSQSKTETIAVKAPKEYDPSKLYKSKS